MKNFYDITVAVCSERSPTASLVLPLMDKTLKMCQVSDGDSGFSKQLKRAITTNLQRRYLGEDVRDFLFKATALDPRTKNKGIIPQATWDSLTEDVAAMIDTESIMLDVKAEKIAVKTEDSEIMETPAKRAKGVMDSLLSDDEDDIEIKTSYKRFPAEMAKDEVRSYRESPRSCDTVMFWKLNGHRFYHLERLARKYICAQGTSVSSERVFSTSGDILSAERSCLDPDALDAMIFLKKNASDSCDFLQE